MSREVLSYIAWTGAVVGCGYLLVRVFWSLLSVYKLRKAGPRPLFGARPRLWHDPGTVENLDMRSGPGGSKSVPVPPYRFLEEHDSGSQPSVSVKDGAGRRWRIKWGQEVRSETFAVRLAWACGYFAEITHFIASGTLESCGPLSRAASCVDEHGAFVDARFELDDPAVD